MAKTETETQSGTCVNHGSVVATRELPKLGFPYIYYSMKRMVAKRRPFTCPTCGSAITPD